MMILLVHVATTLINVFGLNTTFNASQYYKFFHIIDHGSVLYLIFLQIRLYEQYDALSSLNHNNDNIKDIVIGYSNGNDDVRLITITLPYAPLLHIIDHGSVLYLIYLQTLLFN